MKKSSIDGLIIFEPKVFSDDRGWFFESFSEEQAQKQGVFTRFVQDNHSFSKKKGTLRGLHFQNQPFAQNKLVRCTSGKILDVAVDLRKGSDTYLDWFSIELSEENKLQLFIPKGFAHGFLTLTDNVQVEYKVDCYYDKIHDRSIAYNDDTIGIDWGCQNPIQSDKDSHAPKLKESDVNF